VREIYIPADEVGEDALRKMLIYIHNMYLPLTGDYDGNATTQFRLPEIADIRLLCDMYKVYLFLGMDHG
jgi:hypothetical protein